MKTNTIGTVVAVLVLLAGPVGLVLAGRGTASDPQPVDAPAAERAEAQVPPALLETLRTDGRYKILVAVLEDTEFSAVLDAEAPYTFFAPTDEAFEKVPKLAKLLKDREKLVSVLKRHVLPGVTLTQAEIRERVRLVPLAGEPLKVKAESDETKLNDAKMIAADRRVQKGLVHGIDHVLMDNNDSWLRETGATIEDHLKRGADAIHDGVKEGAKKAKETFNK